MLIGRREVRSAVGRAVSDADVTVHVAGVIGGPACAKQSALARRIALQGTDNIPVATAAYFPLGTLGDFLGRRYFVRTSSSIGITSNSLTW